MASGSFVKTLFKRSFVFGSLLLSLQAVSAPTWTQTGAPTNQNWNSIASSADGVRLAAVIGAKTPTSIYISTNSGGSWTTNGSPSQVWGVIASSANGNILVASTASYLAA